MPINFRPSDVGGGSVDASGSNFAGTSEVSAVPAAETQLNTHVDISAARQFFQPSGAEQTIASKAIAITGAESSAIGAKAVGAIAGVGGEAAALGNIGMPPVGGGEISPIVQLIMRLPGMTGVAQSFFEWLGALFGGGITDAFNPALWAGVGEAVRSSILRIGTQGISGDHFQFSLSLLPANAQIFHQIGMQAGHNLSNIHSSIGGIDSLGSQNLSTMISKDHLNISSPLDLKKPQFEIGGSSQSNMFKLDGKLAGPEISNNFAASHLSGTQRLFSDMSARPTAMLTQASSTGTANSIVSNTGTPVGASNSSLNIGSTPFGNEAGALPASYNISDGIISDPGVSSNVGFKLSDAAGARMDNAPSLAPSGAVSDTLGGNQLLAGGEVPNYAPSMGGYFKPIAPRADQMFQQAVPKDSGLQGLKAEPMSLMKKVKVGGDHAAVDRVGHQTKGPVSHSQSNNSSSGGGNSQAMDQISHKGQGNHGADHAHKPAAKHVESHKHAEKSISHAKPQVKHEAVKQAAPEQNSNVTDQTAMQEAGTDQVAGNYTVKHGDCLWEIAKKNLGDGSRWTEIYKLNSDVIGTNPDLIHTGLDLKMPGADGTQITDAGKYSVQPGDNLWDIAKDKLGDGSRWGEIYKANEAVIGDNPRMIFSGQQLDIPGQTMISQVDPSAAAQSGMQPTAMGSADPNMATQGSPDFSQQAVPQTQSYVPQQQMPQQGVSMEGRPELSYVPQELPVGPGAAAAATLDPSQLPGNGPVSASLAPDLSFLYNSKQR